MMFSKIVVAFSPLLLTVIVLRNPVAGILATMTMGLSAFLLLMGLATLRSRRSIIS